MEDRFNSKYIVLDNGCWEWQAACRNAGYGCLKVNGKVVDSHRVSYTLHKGEIPDGMFVCHTCDNRKCVNPDHLFLGTAKDNYWDGRNKGRIKRVVHERVLTHPSYTLYRNGCRCRPCRDLKAAAVKRYRNKIKNLKNENVIL